MQQYSFLSFDLPAVALIEPANVIHDRQPSNVKMTIRIDGKNEPSAQRETLLRHQTCANRGGIPNLS
jgi:hypothetical protein